MKGYITNIEKLMAGNQHFREVLYTGKSSQLVVMHLPPEEMIGEEIHDVDQFIRCESGKGKAVLDGVEHMISDGFVVMIPAGTKHNILNTSADEPLKLYTLYAPPHHRDGVVHHTRADAEADTDDHFDGKATEEK